MNIRKLSIRLLVVAAVSLVILTVLFFRGAVGPVATAASDPSQPIQHVVVIMQENRSFDHLFNGFPGADTVQFGMNHAVRVPLKPVPLGNGSDVDHTHTGWWQQWDNGKMDNF